MISLKRLLVQGRSVYRGTWTNMRHRGVDCALEQDLYQFRVAKYLILALVYLGRLGAQNCSYVNRGSMVTYYSHISTHAYLLMKLVPISSVRDRCTPYV